MCLWCGLNILRLNILRKAETVKSSQKKENLNEALNVIQNMRKGKGILEAMNKRNKSTECTHGKRICV